MMQQVQLGQGDNDRCDHEQDDESCEGLPAESDDPASFGASLDRVSGVKGHRGAGSFPGCLSEELIKIGWVVVHRLHSVLARRVSDSI